MDIRIEPFPPARGRKAVLVEGERWGTVHMDQHGSGGSSYWFEQVGEHGPIHEPPEPGQGRRERMAKVWSSRRHDRRRSIWEYGPFLPTEAKIEIKARELVARGLLRDPKLVKAEQDAAHQRFRQRLAEEAAQERQQDLLTAMQLIEQHAPGLNDRQPLAEAIAAALKQARDRAI